MMQRLLKYWGHDSAYQNSRQTFSVLKLVNEIESTFSGYSGSERDLLKVFLDDLRQYARNYGYNRHLTPEDIYFEMQRVALRESSVRSFGNGRNALEKLKEMIEKTSLEEFLEI